MSTVFDRLAMRLLASGEAGAGEPEAPPAGVGDEARRRRLKLLLIVLALMSLPLVYAAISNIVKLTPPEGTVVTPPPSQPTVQVAVNPAPPIWGSTVAAGEWRNVTVSITNPQPGMYIKLKFSFNATASAGWVTVLFDGVGPDFIVTQGNEIYMSRFIGQTGGLPLKIRLNQPNVKLNNAELWIDLTASVP